MSEYTEPRAGFDVTELMWIKETAFKSTPTVGAWNHFGDPISMAPAAQKTYRDRIGLGRQIAKGFTPIKKWWEPVVEYDILAKDATNGYEWVESLAAILGLDEWTSALDLEKRIMGRSIGAMLDLPTGSDDEYWLLKGCKTAEYELFSAMDENIHCRERLVSIGASGYSTTDYVSGTATRPTFPTTEPLINDDIDIKVQNVSVLSDLINWRFRVTRDLEKHGSQSGTAQLYNKVIEMKCTVALELTMDFVNKTHLNQYLNATKIYAEILIPSASPVTVTLGASGDKQGVWKTMTKPARELDLISLTIRGEFDTIAVA